MRTKRVSNRRKPWLSANLKKLMTNRDRLKKISVRAGSKHARKAYKEARNAVNAETVKAKKDYFSTKFMLLKEV